MTELWAIGVGCKMPWGTFASLYEGSLEPGAPVTIDLGKTRLRPEEDHLVLYRVPGGGKRGLVFVDTEEHGAVQCRTYTLCGTNSGTLHYSIKVRVCRPICMLLTAYVQTPAGTAAPATVCGRHVPHPQSPASRRSRGSGHGCMSLTLNALEMWDPFKNVPAMWLRSRYLSLVHIIKQSVRSALKSRPLTASQLRAFLRTIVTAVAALEEIASNPEHP